MSEPQFLKHRFTNQTREQWEAEAKRSLKGREVSDLASHTADGIEIDVLYQGQADASPIANMAVSAPEVFSLVVENDVATANAQILSELEGGVSGVVLPLVHSGKMGLSCEIAAIEGALDGVFLEAAAISFRPTHEAIPLAARLCSEFLEERDGNFQLFSLGADPIGASYAAKDGLPGEGLKAVAKLAAKGDIPNNVSFFTASGLYAHENGGTEAIELAAMLGSTVTYLRALEDVGLPLATGAQLIGLEVCTDADLFVSLAKLRAGRMLLTRVAEAAPLTAPFAGLHVQTSARMMAKSDVATNMLRTTTAALAAGLGGADSLTVLPFTHAIGKPDGLARRIARNTGTILAEESFIGSVSDPARGAGYIEHLSHQMAAKAWAIFQQVEAVGGAASQKGTSLMRDKIEEADHKRQAEIASGATKLVGVNAFENAGDQLPPVEAWPK